MPILIFAKLAKIFKKNHVFFNKKYIKKLANLGSMVLPICQIGKIIGCQLPIWQKKIANSKKLKNKNYI